MSLDIDSAVQDVTAFIFDQSCGDVYRRSSLRHVIQTIGGLMNGIMSREFGKDNQMGVPAHKDTNYLTLRTKAVYLMFNIIVAVPGSVKSLDVMEETSFFETSNDRSFTNSQIARTDQVEQLKQYVLYQCILPLIIKGILNPVDAIELTLRLASMNKSSTYDINNWLVTNYIPPILGTDVGFHCVNPLLAKCIIEIKKIVNERLFKKEDSFDKTQFLNYLESLSCGNKEDLLNNYNTVPKELHLHFRNILYPDSKNAIQLDPLVRLITIDYGYLDCIFNYILLKYNFSLDKEANKVDNAGFNFLVILPLIEYLINNSIIEPLISFFNSIKRSNLCNEWGFLFRPILHKTNINSKSLKLLLSIYDIVKSSKSTNSTIKKFQNSMDCNFLLNALLINSFFIRQSSYTTFLRTSHGSDGIKLVTGDLNYSPTSEILSRINKLIEKVGRPIFRRIFVIVSYYLSDCNVNDFNSILLSFDILLKFVYVHKEKSSELISYTIWPLLNIIDQLSSFPLESRKNILNVSNTILDLFKSKPTTATILKHKEERNLFNGIAQYVYLSRESTQKFIYEELERRVTKLNTYKSDIIPILKFESLNINESGREIRKQGIYINENSNMEYYIRPRLLQFLCCGLILNKTESEFSRLHNLKKDIIDIGVLPFSVCSFLLKHGSDPHINAYVIPRLSYLLDNRSPNLLIEIYSLSQKLIQNDILQPYGLNLLFNICLKETRMKKNWNKSLKSIVKIRKGQKINDKNDFIICTLLYNSIELELGSDLDYLPYLNNMINSKNISYSSLSILIKCFSKILSNKSTDPPSLWDALLLNYFKNFKISNDIYVKEEYDDFLINCSILYSEFYKHDTDSDSYLEFMKSTVDSMLKLFNGRLELFDACLSTIRDTRVEDFFKPILIAIRLGLEVVIYDTDDIKYEDKKVKELSNLDELVLGSETIKRFIDIDINNMTRPMFKGFGKERRAPKIESSKDKVIKDEYELGNETEMILNSNFISAEAFSIIKLCYSNESAVRNLGYLLSNIEPPLNFGKFLSHSLFVDVLESWKHYWCRQVKNHNYNLNGGVALSLRHFESDNGDLCDVALSGIALSELLPIDGIRLAVSSLCKKIKDNNNFVNDSLNNNEMDYRTYQFNGLLSLSFFLKSMPKSETSLFSDILDMVCSCLDSLLFKKGIVHNEFIIWFSLTNLLLFFSTDKNNTLSNVALPYLEKLIKININDESKISENLTIDSISGIWSCLLYSPYLNKSIDNAESVVVENKRLGIMKSLFKNSLKYTILINNISSDTILEDQHLVYLGLCGNFITRCLQNNNINVLENISKDKVIIVLNNCRSTLSKIKENDLLGELKNAFEIIKVKCELITLFENNKYYSIIEFNKVEKPIIDILSKLNDFIDSCSLLKENEFKDMQDKNINQLIVSIISLVTYIGHFNGMNYSELVFISLNNNMQTTNIIIRSFETLIKLGSKVSNMILSRAILWSISSLSIIKNKVNLIDSNQLKVIGFDNDIHQEIIDKEKSVTNDKVFTKNLKRDIVIETDESATLKRFNKDSGKLFKSLMLSNKLQSEGKDNDLNYINELVFGLYKSKRLPVINWSRWIEPHLETLFNVDFIEWNNKQIELFKNVLKVFGHHSRFDYMLKDTKDIKCDDLNGIINKIKSLRKRRLELLNQDENSDYLNIIDTYTASPSMAHVLLTSIEYFIDQTEILFIKLNNPSYINNSKTINFIKKVMDIFILICDDEILGTLFILAGFVPSNIVGDYSDIKMTPYCNKLEIQIPETRFVNVCSKLVNIIMSINKYQHLINYSNYDLLNLRIVEIFDLYLKYDFESMNNNNNLERAPQVETLYRFQNLLMKECTNGLYLLGKHTHNIRTEQKKNINNLSFELRHEQIYQQINLHVSSLMIKSFNEKKNALNRFSDSFNIIISCHIMEIKLSHLASIIRYDPKFKLERFNDTNRPKGAETLVDIKFNKIHDDFKNLILKSLNDKIQLKLLSKHLYSFINIYVSILSQLSSKTVTTTYRLLPVREGSNFMNQTIKPKDCISVIGSQLLDAITIAVINNGTYNHIELILQLWTKSMFGIDFNLLYILNEAQINHVCSPNVAILDGNKVINTDNNEKGSINDDNNTTNQNQLTKLIKLNKTNNKTSIGSLYANKMIKNTHNINVKSIGPLYISLRDCEEFIMNSNGTNIERPTIKTQSEYLTESIERRITKILKMDMDSDKALTLNKFISTITAL